jgi:hypothetical protein
MSLSSTPGSFCFSDFFAELDDCYTDTERAFLSDYFGIRRPDHLKNLDVYEPVPQGIFVKRCRYSSEYDVANAVARLCLIRIQDELPAWAGVNNKGELVVARSYSRSDVSAMNFHPQHLFTINWADSGPGFSWPEAYYLVWLPVFERYVVTASQDSTDCYGFEDIAIGWQFFDEDRIGLAKEIIQANWGAVHKPDKEEGWICLFGTGLVSESEAEAWREETWSYSNDNDDDEEDEEDCDD